MAWGCSADDPATGATDSTDTTDATATTGDVGVQVTYYEDVLPVFVDNCLRCHEEGGVAPFVIENYEDAVAWGPAIRAAVQARTMPPYNADNSGVCNTFKDARWLSDDQIQMITDWVDGGTLEGDPSTPQPPMPPLNELKGETIVELATPEYVPAVGANGNAKYDDYRCFPLVLDVGDSPRYLTGYEVIPGNDAVVHHAVGFKVDPNAGQNQVVMTLLDNKTPEAGWECFGAAGEGVIPDGSPITWAPGGGALNFPEGTGIKFESGEILVLQMHYNLLNGDGPDTTQLRLSWADEVEREAWSVLDDPFLLSSLGGGGIELEAGKERVTFNWDTSVAAMVGHDGPIDVLAILPHMHERGQRMQVNLKIDGQDHCGIYVDRWNFNWQDSYYLERPFQMQPYDKLEVTCEWNTEGDSDPVQPGFGTQNEMCLIGIYAAAAKESRG